MTDEHFGVEIVVFVWRWRNFRVLRGRFFIRESGCMGDVDVSDGQGTAVPYMKSPKEKHKHEMGDKVGRGIMVNPRAHEGHDSNSNILATTCI